MAVVGFAGALTDLGLNVYLTREVARGSEHHRRSELLGRVLPVEALCVPCGEVRQRIAGGPRGAHRERPLGGLEPRLAVLGLDALTAMSAAATAIANVGRPIVSIT